MLICCTDEVNATQTLQQRTLQKYASSLKMRSLHYLQNTSSIHDHGQRRIISNKNLIAVVKDSDFLFEFRVFEY